MASSAKTTSTKGDTKDNGSTTARAAGAAHAGVDKAAEAVEPVEEHLRETGERLQSQAGDVLAAARGFVHERPMTSLGIAFLAGTLLSSMMRR